MRRNERLALATIVGLLTLVVGILDVADPTPAMIRWPLVALVAGGLALVTWRLSGR